jgi:prevent-host-death family protein
MTQIGNTVNEPAPRKPGLVWPDRRGYYGHVITASVSEAKNKLSALLAKVKAGETVLILDRGRPVARLEPATSAGDDEARIARLERAGIARRPKNPPLPADFFDKNPPIELPPGVSVLEALLDERRESPY